MRCAGVPPRIGAVVPSAAHLPSLFEMVELQATYWQKLLDTVASGLPFAVDFSLVRQLCTFAAMRRAPL